MVVQEVSLRELARAAGWKSHWVLQQLLDERSPYKTVTPERAQRIADYLKVSTEDIFLTGASFKTERHDDARAVRSAS
jgi:hypothetical protein